MGSLLPLMGFMGMCWSWGWCRGFAVPLTSFRLEKSQNFPDHILVSYAGLWDGRTEEVLKASHRAQWERLVGLVGLQPTSAFGREGGKKDLTFCFQALCLSHRAGK